ncbi:hypothetical protein NDU88_001283, partial [Pleurodeles waltl]
QGSSEGSMCSSLPLPLSPWHISSPAAAAAAGALQPSAPSAWHGGKQEAELLLGLLRTPLLAAPALPRPPL